MGAAVTGSVRRGLKRAAGVMLDFTLPPRCAGCAEVIDEVGGFCAHCWSEVNWIGVGRCRICGIPLEATKADVCLAAPPPLDRMRAAVAYGDLPRTIALRLKYGRKIALARTMARFAVARGPVRRRNGGAGAASPLAAVVAGIQPVRAGRS